MQSDLAALLSESATLLFVGMAVVYLFLALLIIAVKLVAALCIRYPGEGEVVKYSRQNRSSGSISEKSELSPAKVAAITAAIHQFRNANA